MSKVQRLLQQGHDEWYVERRDLYHTLLYEAHTAGSASSQKGILSFARAAATYTPLIAPSPLPSARVLRRAHLIMEIEKMPMYRHQLLSVTGEILCIDGTRKVCIKYLWSYGTDRLLINTMNVLLCFHRSSKSYMAMARAPCSTSPVCWTSGASLWRQQWWWQQQLSLRGATRAWREVSLPGFDVPMLLAYSCMFLWRWWCWMAFGWTSTGAGEAVIIWRGCTHTCSMRLARWSPEPNLILWGRLQKPSLWLKIEIIPPIMISKLFLS